MSKTPQKHLKAIKSQMAYLSSLEKQLRMRGLSHENIRRIPKVLDAEKRIEVLQQEREVLLQERRIARALRNKQREDRNAIEEKSDASGYPLSDSLPTDIKSKQGAIHETALIASKKASKKLVKDLSDELFVQRRVNGVPECKLKELRKDLGAAHIAHKKLLDALAEENKVDYKEEVVEQTRTVTVVRTFKIKEREDILEGFVYVLTDSHVPNLFKIGKTIRDPHTRAGELRSDTGALNWKVKTSFRFDNCHVAEKKIHSSLCKYRLPNKEIFACDYETVMKAFRYISELCK